MAPRGIPRHGRNRPCGNSDGETDFIVLPTIDSSRLARIQRARTGKVLCEPAFREIYFQLRGPGNCCFALIFKDFADLVAQKRGIPAHATP